MKKYAAEFLGTFLLALAVGVSLGSKFPVATPLIAGLTLGLCVYTLGGISGTHINPSITIGLLTIGKIDFKDAAAYLVSQFLGAGAAWFVAGLLLPARAVVAADNSLGIFGAEALGAFVLALGVASVVHGKAPAPAAGLTIGGSLLLGISLAVPLSNGVLNPAVAVGIGSISASYLLGPLVGAAAAMLLYRAIN